MKPSFTCYTARAILKAIGSNLRTDHNGHPVDASFPDFSSLDAASARAEWQAYNLTRKLVLSEKSPDCAKKALAGFLKREEQNAELNRGNFPTWVLPYLWVAKQVCEDLLGSTPDMRRVYNNSVFTGGASTSRKRSESHPALKWWARRPLDVTPQASRYLAELKSQCEVLDTVWSMPGVLSCTTYCDMHKQAYFKIVPGSRFDTVDKDFGIDRTIIIEPDGNMLLQRGVGITIRELLLKVGIDLRKQDNNRHHARLGALYGDRATLDVRDASNSLYRMLFCMVFPDDWYNLLIDLRSPLTKLPDGSWHKLEMISSMGNGFTFEVETLLFYCLCEAVRRVEKCSGVVTAYGDDIITPTGCARATVALFDAIGIEINKGKSFIDGPFRESCGWHFHGVANVTPFYMRSELTTDEAIFCFVNQYHYWLTGDYTVAPPVEHMRIIETVLARCTRRPQIPLEYANDSGVYSPLYGEPIKVRYNRRGSVVALVVSLRPFRVGKCRVESELAWLYQHVSRSPSRALHGEWKIGARVRNHLGFDPQSVRVDRYTPLDIRPPDRKSVV